jgi:hypothetical protein
MAAHGETPGLPTPAGAIFADTQDEPASVYAWLDWLEAEIARCPHPFPVHRVTRGKLSERTLTIKTTADGRKFSSTDVPFFTLNHDGSQGKVTNRSCTRDFKITPILRKARQLAAVPRKRRANNEIHVIQWIGISLDEIYRMKPVPGLVVAEHLAAGRHAHDAPRLQVVDAEEGIPGAAALVVRVLSIPQ